MNRIFYYEMKKTRRDARGNEISKEKKHRISFADELPGKKDLQEVKEVVFVSK